MTSTPSSTTVVLVHGAYADASSWSRVVSRLNAAGVAAIAAPNPLRGLTADGAYIASLVSQIEGPVVLVGHSYGGLVITYASAKAENVKGLVYVASFGNPDAERAAAKRVGATVTEIDGGSHAPGGRATASPDPVRLPHPADTAGQLPCRVHRRGDPVELPDTPVPPAALRRPHGGNRTLARGRSRLAGPSRHLPGRIRLPVVRDVRGTHPGRLRGRAELGGRLREAGRVSQGVPQGVPGLRRRHGGGDDRRRSSRSWSATRTGSARACSGMAIPLATSDG